MEKLSFLVSILLLTLSVSAKAERLPVIFDFHPLYDVVDVELSDSATIVTMKVTADFESRALTATPQLYAPQTHKDLMFKHGYIDDAGKTSISPDVKVKKGDRVVMFFDPHPAGIEEISYIEVQSWNWPRFITGIRLDNKPYHAATLPPTPSLRRDRLPDFEITEADTATLDLDMLSRLIHFSFYDVENPCSEDKRGTRFETDTLSRVKGSRFDIIPRSITYLINGTKQTWLAVPGTKTRLAFDSGGYAEAIENGVSPREAWAMALNIYEAPLPEMYTTLRYDTSDWSVIKDSHRNLSFEDYVGILKKELNERKKRISDDNSLSGAEKEFLQLKSEEQYFHDMSIFLILKKYEKSTEEEMERYREDFTWKDPDASSFLTATSPGAIYVLSLDAYMPMAIEFLRANNLNDAPLLKIMDEYYAYADSALAARDEVRRANWISTAPDAATGIVKLPDCEPEKILETILQEHKGRTVLVDIWATWCGPCRAGMKELEPYKEELSRNGVDFIYFTIESSDKEEWQKIVAGHKGSHYVLLDEIKEKMKIPGFSGSIPFYLIYRPDGTLFTVQEGWNGVENLIDSIEKSSR